MLQIVEDFCTEADKEQLKRMFDYNMSELLLPTMTYKGSSNKVVIY